MVRIMPLGDSITWGVINNRTSNVESGGYRTVLYDALLRNGFTNPGDFNFVGTRDDTEPQRGEPDGIDRDNQGHRGWRTDELLYGRPPLDPLNPQDPNLLAGNINTWLAEENPDVVLLMIGTNDIRQNVPVATAIDNLTRLIEVIVDSSARVLVASIPPGADNTRIGQFNAAIPGLVANRRNATFVDVNNVLNQNDLSPDGIHPNSLGYSKIANAWYNALLPILDPNISSNVGSPRETQSQPIRLEAENFTNLGSFISERPNVPDTQVISLPANGRIPVTSTASRVFTPPAPGRYDVVIGYFDENDAAGQLQVTIGNNNLPALNLGQNLNSEGVTTRNFVRRTVARGLSIDGATPIQITGTSAFAGLNGDELVRVDYVEFVPVNDAPVLDANLVQSLSIASNSTTNAGDLVSDILGNAITDLDTGAVEGIAVIAADNTNGRWEYSTNNGTTWTNFGNLSAANARLLAADANTRIRFVSNGSSDISPTLTFRAWDRTRGTAGSTIDLRNANTIGGSRAFSLETATTTVLLNNAPVLTPGLVGNLTSINEDATTNNGDSVAALLGNAVTDADAEAVLGMAAIAVDNTNGRWEYSTNNGTTWTGFGTLSAANARLLAADDRIRFVPNLNYNGTPTGITFRAWDQTRGTPGNTVNLSAANAVGGSRAFSAVTATSTLSVLPVNDVPVANDDSAVTNEDAAVNINALNNDTDADREVLALSLVTGSLYGTVSLNDNGTPDNLADDFFTYTPNANFVGTDQFTYQVSDRNGGTDTATVNITVNAVNDAPVANSDSTATLQNRAVSINVLSNDIDLDNNTLAIARFDTTSLAGGTITLDNGGNADPTDDRLIYTPASNFVGTDSFNYTVSDGTVTATATVTLSVNAVNTPPIANPDTATTLENQTVTLNVLSNDSDPDGNTLAIAGFDIASSTGGSITLDNGGNADPTDDRLLYTPAPGFIGTDSFNYTVSDGTDTATATVTLSVNAVNRPPIANADNAITVQNRAVSINVLANDSDPDGNTLLLASFATTSTAGGSITLDNRGNDDRTDDALLYTPATGFIGTDSFNYTLTDGTNTATATVTVNVNNDPPLDPDEPPPTPDEPPANPNEPLRLVHNPDDSFSISGSPGQAQLRFRLNSRNTDNVNEIGVFAVDDAQGTIDGIAPGSPGYLQAALSRGQVVFSVLPDGFASDNPTRQIEGFNVGTRLGFYLVQDSTTDAVLAGQTASVFFGSPSFNASGFDYLQVEAVNNGGYTLAWNDSAGSGNFDDIVMSVEAIAPSSPLPLGVGLQGGQQQELIDLTASSGLVANFNYRAASEAVYNNTVGLYVVEDEQGTVLDSLTGNRIAPGEVGYAQAAIRRTVMQMTQEASGSVQLASGIILAPYIIADSTVDEFLADNANNQAGQGSRAYFAFLGANSDGVDHVRLLGDNRFGFEDVLGGGDRDYNDIVFQVDIAFA